MELFARALFLPYLSPPESLLFLMVGTGEGAGGVFLVESRRISSSVSDSLTIRLLCW